MKISILCLLILCVACTTRKESATLERHPVDREKPTTVAQPDPVILQNVVTNETYIFRSNADLETMKAVLHVHECAAIRLNGYGGYDEIKKCPCDQDLKELTSTDLAGHEYIFTIMAIRIQ